MASFDSTIGILRDDLSFAASFRENNQTFSLDIFNPLMSDGIPADHMVVFVSGKDQLYALRAALYSALADSYALESQALTILPALTGNAIKDKANRPPLEEYEGLCDDCHLPVAEGEDGTCQGHESYVSYWGPTRKGRLMPDPATYTTTCAYCSAELTVSGKGKNSNRYCSKSHKTMAYRRRQTARGISRNEYEHRDRKRVDTNAADAILAT